MKDEKIVILFDGVCNLCNGVVQYIIKRDHQDQFRFASLQSDWAKDYFKTSNKQLINMDSIYVIRDNKLYYKAKAVRIITLTLGFPYTVINIFGKILPIGFQNWIYDFIAKNRYKWFGKTNDCWLPSPLLKRKFL